MRDIGLWEVQTEDLLKRLQEEKKEAQSDAERRIAALDEKIWAVQKALETFREMMGIKEIETLTSLNPKDITNKSQHEILKLLALRNNKLLVVKTAIRLMKEANVFGNPLNAAAAVYSVLKRSNEFVRIGKGLYKLNGHKDKPTEVKGYSGLKQAIKELKEKNPQITKPEVIANLTQQGFDFKGKKPARAVHMAWVNLGYAKKEIQQPLNIQV